VTKNQFLLLKLAEECAEVAQRAIKQMQFGKDEKQVDQPKSNAERLNDEITDLKVISYLLEIEREIPALTMEEFYQAI
jgi:NTP pyrophosphatase (non-canonical NTP hydrolase)